MKLVSMKRDAEKDERDDSKECCESAHSPDFPWGTRLCLEDEQLQKLGLESMPAAGARLQIGGVGEVIGFREEQVDGKTKRTLDIQITELGVEGIGRPIAQRMYPDKD